MLLDPHDDLNEEDRVDREGTTSLFQALPHLGWAAFRLLGEELDREVLDVLGSIIPPSLVALSDTCRQIL